MGRIMDGLIRRWAKAQDLVEAEAAIAAVATVMMVPIA